MRLLNLLRSHLPSRRRASHLFCGAMAELELALDVMNPARAAATQLSAPTPLVRQLKAPPASPLDQFAAAPVPAGGAPSSTVQRQARAPRQAEETAQNKADNLIPLTGNISDIQDLPRNPKGIFRNLFEPVEVAPGKFLPGRIGAHFPAGTHYPDQVAVEQLVKSMKSAGVSYSTVIVNSDNPQDQSVAISTLRAHGLEPVVRLILGGEYNRTLDTLDEGKMDRLVQGADQLAEMGVTFIQLDNEPNWSEGGKMLFDYLNDPVRYPADEYYKPAMDQYAAKLAELIRRIHEKHPETVVLFGGLAPTPAQTSQFWDDLLFRLAAHNEASGGTLLVNVGVATHPYTNGDTSNPALGVEGANQLVQRAKDILGIELVGVATEGMNPTDMPSQEARSAEINFDELIRVAQVGGTQSLWLWGDAFVGGAGTWESHAVIKQGGGYTPTVGLMFRIAAGQVTR